MRLCHGQDYGLDVNEAVIEGLAEERKEELTTELAEPPSKQQKLFVVEHPMRKRTKGED